MRTNIVIDEKLMKKASKALGTRTQRETVEEALRKVVNLNEQADIKKFFGKVKWEGDLDEMRQSR
ncbi:MAG: type II toxin-antitoxin system VapB family antitoxin [Ignavibacteriaceae bacterium]